MGEIADDHSSESVDSYWDQEEYEYEEFERPVSPKTCQYCGQGGLHWEHTERGWRLHDVNQEMHTCDKFPLKREYRGKK